MGVEMIVDRYLKLLVDEECGTRFINNSLETRGCGLKQR